MRIKLAVSDESYEKIESELKKLGIEIADDAELILSEKNKYVSSIIVRDKNGDGYTRLSTSDIVLIESFGHKIVVHSQNDEFIASDRLYQLSTMLDAEKFLRISNSVIIATDKVKKIKPTFSMKYILTMSNGKCVDVTRSYYNLFREYYGI